MSRRLRYFANPYPDFDGRQPVQIDPEVWKRHALDVADNIQQNFPNVLTSDDGGLYVGSGILFNSDFVIVFQRQAKVNIVKIKDLKYEIEHDKRSTNLSNM
jgi:hypothetical protein